MKKYFLFIFLACSSIAFINAQNTIAVPAGQSIEINYPDYKSYEVLLQTVGLREVDVSVVTKDTGVQIRGFGLDKLGKEEILVEQGNKLLLKNNSERNIKVKYSINPYKKEMANRYIKYIEFTLRNSSKESIPLIIPTVMNPNLSPESNSGVSLKPGQEIFFKANGRKQLLLVVDQTIQNGDVIDVANLLPTRKKELGLKR